MICLENFVFLESVSDIVVHIFEGPSTVLVSFYFLFFSPPWFLFNVPLYFLDILCTQINIYTVLDMKIVGEFKDRQ